MANRPRVVHLTTVHHPLDPRIYRKEVKSLQRAGFDVSLIARSAGVDELDGVRFVPLPDRPGPIARLRRQFSAWRELKSIKPALLHVHDPELLPLASRYRRFAGAKIVYDKHEHYGSRPGVEGRALEMLERWAFGWVDHLILAEEGYLDLVQNKAVPKTVILNYAIPPTNEYSLTESAPSDKIRVVYTGTISRGRGLFRLIDLAIAIRNREAPVTIELVGICNYPKERAEAERKIRSETLDAIISVSGWDRYASGDDLDAAQRRSRLGIMLAEPDPNYSVSIPTKFYDYLQYGLPLVVERLPRWVDFVERTGAGVVVDSNDPDKVLDALLETASDVEFAKYQRHALQAAPAYRWSEMEMRLIDVYDGVGISAA